jgi:hypothetical protein
MFRRCLRFLALLPAGLALAGTCAAADVNDAKKPPPPVPRGFFQKFLSPTMSSRLDGEASAVAELTNPAANPWMRDEHTVTRIERGALYAATGALKQYAMHALQLDVLSIPVIGGNGIGVGAAPADTGGTRLRFGISHLTPRADLLIPSAHGRVVVSADARGRVSTSFDAPATKLNIGVAYDPLAHSGEFSLCRRF